MSIPEALWFNLAVDSFAIVIAAIYVRSLGLGVTFVRGIFAVGHDNAGGWRPDKLTEVATKADVQGQEIKDIKVNLAEVEKAGTLEELKKHFVTREEFSPIRKIVFLVVGIVVSTAVGSFLAVIWKTGPGGKVGP